MDEDEIDLSDSFFGDPDVNCSFSPDAAGYSDTSRPTNTSLSREQLIAQQRSDVSLSPLFEAAVAGEEVESFSTGYFVKDDLIKRKWMPLSASADDDRSVVTQIVVLSPYRSEILNLPHDNPLAGHRGLRKTYDCILQHFFWPSLKRDVARYCKHMSSSGKTEPDHSFCTTVSKPSCGVSPA